MSAHLEHANVTVSDPSATAAWMEKLFGWHIRWQGNAIDGGKSIHIGNDASYLALYAPATATSDGPSTHKTVGGLNHIAVVVDDLDATEIAIKEHGFETNNHGDYEPGRRFYFRDTDGIDFEVVHYA